MCGRYASFLPVEAVRNLFATVNTLVNAPPSWNIAPTQDALVVRLHPETGERHLDLLRWGLLPFWAKDPKTVRQPFNARAETLATAPMFRDAFARRRALIPADLFYEWQALPGGKQPLAIARADLRTMALGGLWEGWRGADGTVIRSFTIVTTAANDALRPIHERMPLILEPADWPAWLGETPDDAARMLRPATAELRIWKVAPLVNNVRNNDARLIEPVA